MFSAIINAAVIFVLVLNNVQSYSLPGVNYRSSSIDTVTPTPPPTNFKWTFNEDVRREPRQSLNRIYENQGRIYFPNTNLDINLRFGTVPSCVGTTVCEDVTEYPSHLANEILENNPQLRNYQSVDVVDSIGLRIDVPSTTSLCPSYERVIYPKSAENVNKEWMYILNNNNFTQGVRVETCMNEGGTCKILDGLTNGYVTSCKQKYAFRQLVAMRQDGSPIKDLFRMPSSCCCHIEFVADLATERFLV